MRAAEVIYCRCVRKRPDLVSFFIFVVALGKGEGAHRRGCVQLSGIRLKNRGMSCISPHSFVCRAALFSGTMAVAQQMEGMGKNMIPILQIFTFHPGLLHWSSHPGLIIQKIIPEKL